MDFDSILQRAGLTRDTLNAGERETLERWAKQLSTQQIGIRELNEYINQMITSLERELAGYEDTPTTFASIFFRGKRMKHVKARLYNYIMIRDFITAPDRARSYVEKHISNITKS